MENVLSDFGINLLEDEIDSVIFRTNEFLCDETFIGPDGPFWFILQMCTCLAAFFAIVMAAQMAYRMLSRGEPLDVMRLFRPLAVAIVMCWWYPPGRTGVGYPSDYCLLDFLAYIPNCIGSYTHDLYEAEAVQIGDQYERAMELIAVRDSMAQRLQSDSGVAKEGMMDRDGVEAASEATDAATVVESQRDAFLIWLRNLMGGSVIMLDKVVMLVSLVVYRVGWWSTIYCQQILLGMLTVFGPIQWAFSLLPKWEGAWARWTTRYLTVHLYGAMLYLVGFYVLLLFDIVLCIQVDSLEAITASDETMAGYLQNAFYSCAYMMAASLVSLKCLNLVPDLAAWMIPEGDTAFSTRNFGEGVAQGARVGAMSVLRRIL